MLISPLSAVNFGCEAVVKYPIGRWAAQTSPAEVVSCDLGHKPTPRPPFRACHSGSLGLDSPACI